MKYRLKTAWAALLGRPVVANATFDAPVILAPSNRRGVVVGNTMPSPNSAPRRS